MAKTNTQMGALVVSTRTIVHHDGIVESVTDSGVTIRTREFGRQTKVLNFYPRSSIVAHSSEGEGFVIVEEELNVAVYYGNVSSDASGVSVETEGGMVITAPNHPNVTYKVVLDDGDSPSTTVGKEGRRRSDRLDRRNESSKAKPKKSDPETSKKKKSGKRRD